jgi:hypothetical protein
MAYGEIKACIALDNSQRVVAYFVLHNGVEDSEPPKRGLPDQVWYARGSVTSQPTPTPHLAGNLSPVWATNRLGIPIRKTRVSVSVEIYPDGKFTYLQRIGGNPVGGLPAKTVQMTDIGEVLIMGIDGNQVISVGVARDPEPEENL